MSEHVVIVGGGIVGCMTAMELVERGYRVTIVERNQIASQTSGESSWAGGGIIFPLLPWMYAEPVNTLTGYGAGAYAEICKKLEKDTGLPTGFINSGFLILPPFDEETAIAWCESHGQTFALRDQIYPLLSPIEGSALWMPEVCQARPPFFMKALRQWLVQQGVTLLEHTELLPLGDAASLDAWQTTDGRTIVADKFIVTSGAWSFLLLQDVAKNLNIKPMRGQILLYQPPENLKQIVYQNGFYMIPRADGYLLAGSTLEDVGFDASTTKDVRDELMKKAENIMPSLKGLPIIKHWSGLRPGTPENLPTISAHPSIRNLYLNTGHFRYGLTMAPASARLVADLISGNQPFIDASHFALKANA
jgi:glycine oxidase